MKMTNFDKGVDAFRKGDYVTALHELQPLAKQGHSEAQSALGLMYQNGQGVDRDCGQAMKLFKLAAKGGNVAAYRAVGLLYLEGCDNFPPNHKKAVKYFTFAAENGHPKAQYNLGLVYGLGKGVSIDIVEAFFWMNLAVLNGLKEAIDPRDDIKKAMTQEQTEQAEELMRLFVTKQRTDH